MALSEFAEAPQPRHPVIDPTRAEVGAALAPKPLEARLLSFRQSYPGVSGDNLSPRSGDVEDFRESQHQLVRASTDTGVIVRNDQEMVTNKMVGCTTLFIQGPDAKVLVHITPSTRLPYHERADHTVAKVMEALRALGHPLDQYRLVIFGNIGTENGKFGYERLEKLWEELGQKFVEAGIGEARVQELPLDETVVYHTPERPDDVFVMGRRNCYDEKGNYCEYPRQIDSYWIPLKDDQPFDFGLRLRPPQVLAA